MEVPPAYVDRLFGPKGDVNLAWNELSNYHKVILLYCYKLCESECPKLDEFFYEEWIQKKLAPNFYFDDNADNEF